MIAILMMLDKFTTPNLLKIKVFWNNDCDVIVCVNDVTIEISSRDSKSIVDVIN